MLSKTRRENQSPEQNGLPTAPDTFPLRASGRKLEAICTPTKTGRNIIRIFNRVL